MGYKNKVKNDPKKLGIGFQVVPDIESNIVSTFTLMGAAGPDLDSNFGLNPAVEPSSLGPIIEQLPFDDQCTMGVGAVAALSPVATKMVGLHTNIEIEIANLSSVSIDDEAPALPYALPVGQIAQAYVEVQLYHVQVSQSPVTQTFAGLQPNRLSPQYSPEKKLLLSFMGTVSTVPGSNSKMCISEHTQIGRNFEKGDGVALVVISRAANGSYLKQVPLTVAGGMTFWLQN